MSSPTKGQAAVARSSRAHRSPGLAVAAFCVDHALLAGVLAFAGWAWLTGHRWTWLPALVALAVTWEASEVSWDPRAEGPLPSARQLQVRGNLLALCCLVTLALLPVGGDQLVPALLIAVAAALVWRHRVRGWELLSAKHAPGTRLLRCLSRLVDATGGRAAIAVAGFAAVFAELAGVPGSVGFAAAGLAIAAARLYSDADGDRVLLEVRRALAGVLVGGAWDSRVADAGTAPITVDLGDGGVPLLIRMPLPPTWGADQAERLAAEVAARLRPWGTWLVDADPSARTATARPAIPLPEHLLWDGQPGQGRAVTLGMGRVPRQALETDSGAPVGEVVPVVLDLASNPMGLVTGRTGRGKSVAVRSIILQWLMAGNRVVFLDPKRVEGAPWRGRTGVLTVAADLEEITVALDDVVAEMRRRYEILEGEGVQNFVDLPAAMRAGWHPILVVVDEAFELMATAAGSTDQIKAENELRQRCAGSIRSIAALGRAAGVHEILCAQRPDAKVLSGDLKNNLAFRLLCGPADRVARSMTLGEDAPDDVTATPGVLGRAVARDIGLPATELQVAYVDASDLDKHWPRVSTAPPTGPEIDAVEAPPALVVEDLDDLSAYE